MGVRVMGVRVMGVRVMVGGVLVVGLALTGCAKEGPASSDGGSTGSPPVGVGSTGGAAPSRTPSAAPSPEPTAPSFTPLPVPVARVSRIEYAYASNGPTGSYRVVLTPKEGTYQAPPAAPVRRPMPEGLWDDAVTSLGQLPPKETATCSPGSGSSSIMAYAGDDLVRDARASCDPEARARIDGAASRWTEALAG